MRKFLKLLLCLFFAFGNFLFAGKSDLKDKDIENFVKKNIECCDKQKCCKLEKMAKIMNLTAEQKTKIEQIFKDFSAEKMTKKEKFEKEMTDLRNKKNSKIKEVLNEEQKIQFIVFDTFEKINFDKDKEFCNKFKKECFKDKKCKYDCKDMKKCEISCCKCEKCNCKKCNSDCKK